MTIAENKNFASVQLFEGITSEQLKKAGASLHIRDANRAARIEAALDYDRNPVIDRAFEVDKMHVNGPEVHVVSKEGFIYIFNKDKLLKGRNALVTILIARPNQVKRLYKNCGLWVDRTILDKCREHQDVGLNEI